MSQVELELGRGPNKLTFVIIVVPETQFARIQVRSTISYKSKYLDESSQIVLVVVFIIVYNKTLCMRHSI